MSVVWLGDEGTPLFCVLILVRAAAASSKALLTDEVSLRNTSGSANALPSANFATPEKDHKIKVKWWQNNRIKIIVG